MDPLWFIFKVFKQAGVLKTKVGGRKVNVCELRYDLKGVFACRDRNQSVGTLNNAILGQVKIAC